MAFSHRLLHRLHDWQLSCMAGARWLNAPTRTCIRDQRNSVASSAAMLQRDACSKNACATREPHRRTPPHALNITHLPALIQAPDHHALSDIGLETQTMKPAIRGACVWDVPADYVKVAFNVSSLERPQRPPPCGRCSSPSRECSSPSRRNYEITASSKS